MQKLRLNLEYFGKTIRGKIHTQEVLRKMPDYTKYLRRFGEMGVVRSIPTVEIKLEDTEMTCMLIGYAKIILAVYTAC